MKLSDMLRESSWQRPVNSCPSPSTDLPNGCTVDSAVRPEASASTGAGARTQYETYLSQIRLGMASSLAIALRVKHPPTAAHSLRVALFCSAWSHHLGIEPHERDILEVSALLHDVGKIGVPDRVLMKPAPLDADEIELMARHRPFGMEILAGCCCSEEILQSIRLASAWFHDFDTRDEIPLPARMIAIADAFDAMTTDQVYRRAMSQERAIAELFSHAGTQFDPELVENFARLQLHGELQSNQHVSNRWLNELDPADAQRFWQLQHPYCDTLQEIDVESLFHDKLLDHMLHGVIYIDASCRIFRWNAGAERLTGMSTSSMIDTEWDLGALRVWNDARKRLTNEDCPIHKAIESKCQSLQRVIICRGEQELDLDLHAFPILDERGICHGAAALLRDATSETSLEQTVQDLHLRATRDPLTKAANRAEFDSVLQSEVERFESAGVAASLVICDLDHFKSINDTFGHQAGDAVLVSFSEMLHALSRPEDLVARYGGEEFAVICPDCDIASATSRAERFRRELGAMHHAELPSRQVTASFGVTQLQSGDSAETMLRRADRALYMAKQQGRDRVIQLGAGSKLDDKEVDSSGWLGWFTGGGNKGFCLERVLLTQVPLDLAVEKLRGFVADHQAEVVTVEEQYLVLSLDSSRVNNQRRRTDRGVTMVVELRLEALDEARGVGTRIKTSIRPRRGRDRRTDTMQERALQIYRSLKAYLVACEEEPEEE